MKVGWIAPLTRKCGIAFYARKYADALSRHVQLVECDPCDFLKERHDFFSRLAGCDCVHIQYEPSFFLHGRHDFYSDLCSGMRPKKIATVHEIYRKIPGVFPREDIRGIWPLKAIKEVLWDRRHPHWAAYARHRTQSFFADAIMVHALFQKDLLAEKSIDKEKINVLPLPVKTRPDQKPRVVRTKGAAVLGVSGFINPLYDYELLISVLGQLKVEWRFTWVGGLRRDADAGILHRLENEIDKRGWRTRFTITGWVSDGERDRMIDEMDIFCAFFRDRSSSESLSDAITARLPVVATRIPLTEELATFGPFVALVPGGSVETAGFISALLSDKDRLHSMEQAAADYGRRYSYDECAKKMVCLYEKVIAQ
jgi:glycosyltransferase involved in cell wall biosynthesis